VRSVPGRLDIPASYRSYPDLLRYRLLYRLVCFILDNILRFLFYYRVPCNSPCSRRTSKDYYNRLSFSLLTPCFMSFQTLYIRFCSGLSCGNRSIPRYFCFFIFRWFFICPIIFLQYNRVSSGFLLRQGLLIEVRNIIFIIFIIFCAFFLLIKATKSCLSFPGFWRTI
jgi:hypothetical protein